MTFVRHHIGLTAFLLVAVWITACVGCGGGGLNTVEGQVTFDGERVNEGSIIFEPQGDTRASGGVIADGRYSLAGDAALEPGTYLVRILGMRPTGRQVEPMPGAAPVDETEQYIPAKYNKQSQLTTEIPVPGGTQNFALTSQ